MLAGIILSNVLPYLETMYNLPTLWKQNQCDCVSVDALAEVGKDRGGGCRRGRGRTKEIDMKDTSDPLMPRTLL